MAKLLTLATLLFSLMAHAQTNNLPDSVDSNSVPASEEKRAGEVIDSRDSIDLNNTPAALEQREEAEKVDPKLMKSGEERKDMEEEKEDK